MGRKYMGVDVARQGKDFSAIAIFDENRLFLLQRYEFKPDLYELSEEIIKYINLYNIEENCVAIDCDGVGGGVADNLKHMIGMRVYNVMHNSKPLYLKVTAGLPLANLRSQMWWILRMSFMNSEIVIDMALTSDTAARLIEDLTSVKYEMRQDKAIAILGKNTMKRKLGRSPDYGDAVCLANFMRVKYGIRDVKKLVQSSRVAGSLYDVFY